MKRQNNYSQNQFLILFIIIALFIYPTTSIVAFTQDANVRTGLVQYIPDVTCDSATVLNNFVFTYTSPISGTLKLSLGLSSFYFYQCNQISYVVNVTNVGISSSSIKMTLYDSFVVWRVSFMYFVFDSTIPQIQYQQHQFFFTILNEGVGYRSQNITLPIQNSNFLPQVGGIYLILPIQHIKIQNFNGSYFYFDNQVNINRTNYVITFKTADQSLVYYIKFVLLAHDSTFTFTNNQDYERYVYARSYYCNSASYFSTKSVKPNYQASDRVFWGISGFNLTKTLINIWQFNLDPISYVNISTLNFIFTDDSIVFIYIQFFGISFRTCTVATELYNPNSQTCASTCPGGLYPDSATLVCLGCHYSCASSCTGYQPFQCTTCDVNQNRQSLVNVTGTFCVCSPGNLQIFGQSCPSCNSYIKGCNTCSSRTVCTLCKTGLTIDSNNLCRCTSTSSFLSINGSCITIFGCLSFLNESGIIKCTQCNHTALYYQVNFTCFCQPGTSSTFYPNGIDKYCKIICGDGFKRQQQICDDGNMINGDGCSSTCTIQPGYTCVILNPSFSSCHKDFQRSLNYIGTQRDSLSNTAIIFVNVCPYSADFYKITNMTKLIKIDLQYIENTKISTQFSNGPFECSHLKIYVPYTHDMDYQHCNLSLNLNESGYFSYPTTTASFQLEGVNSQLSYHSQSNNIYNYIQGIFITLAIIGFLITFASLLSQRWIGVELMNTIQMFYFYILLLQTLNFELTPINQNLKYFNGYNTLSDLNYFSYYTLPKQLIRSGFQKEFIANFNFMFIPLLLPFLIYLIMLLVNYWFPSQNKIKQSKKKKSYYDQIRYRQFLQKKQMQSIKIFTPQFIWGRFFICMVLIFMNQIIISFVIQSDKIDSVNWNFERLASNATAVLAIIFVFTAYIFIIHWYSYQGRYSQKVIMQMEKNQVFQKQMVKSVLQFPRMNPVYPVFFITFQIIRIVSLSLLYKYSTMNFFLLGLQVIYLILILWIKPYQPQKQIKKQPLQLDEKEDYCYLIHNLHIIWNSVGLIIVLICIIIDDYQTKSEVVPTLIIYLYCFWIIISQILAVIRFFPKKLYQLGQKYCFNNKCCIKSEQPLQQDEQQLKRLSETHMKNSKNKPTLGKQKQKQMHKQKKYHSKQKHNEQSKTKQKYQQDQNGVLISHIKKKQLTKQRSVDEEDVQTTKLKDKQEAASNWKQVKKKLKKLKHQN